MKFSQLPSSVQEILEKDKTIAKAITKDSLQKYDYVLKKYESELKDDAKQTLYLAQTQSSSQVKEIKSKVLLCLNNLKTVQTLNFKMGSHVHLLKKTDYDKEGFFFLYRQDMPTITIYKCI